MEARRLWQDLQGPCQLQRARPATEERTQEENLVPPKAPGIMVSGKVDCQPLMSRILPRLWKTEPGNAPRAQRRTDHDQEKGEEGGGGPGRRGGRGGGGPKRSTTGCLLNPERANARRVLAGTRQARACSGVSARARPALVVTNWPVCSEVRSGSSSQAVRQERGGRGREGGWGGNWSESGSGS